MIYLEIEMATMLRWVVGSRSKESVIDSSVQWVYISDSSEEERSCGDPRLEWYWASMVCDCQVEMGMDNTISMRA